MNLGPEVQLRSSSSWIRRTDSNLFSVITIYHLRNTEGYGWQLILLSVFVLITSAAKQMSVFPKLFSFAALKFCSLHSSLSSSSHYNYFPAVAESVAGFFLSVNTSANITKLRIPYPQTGTWYLSLRSLCATEHGWDTLFCFCTVSFSFPCLFGLCLCRSVVQCRTSHNIK